jgi:hypothetical protein
MGYTTDFYGSFDLDKPLTEAHAKYLKAFSESRRMTRDENKVQSFSDPLREAVGLPIGRQGGYYVNAKGFHGQDHDDSIIDYNRPPNSQPSLWCKWVPSDDGRNIEWDGGEKFYDYIGWIEYLIENFLAPWGYKLNGEVEWQGEDRDDFGMIVVKDNIVYTRMGSRTFGDLREAGE